MVKFYRTDDKLIHELDTMQGGTWIQMVNPSVAEGQMVADELNVDIEDVLAALDEEESSRIELQDGYTLILVDIPSIETRHDKESYTTIPLGIILTDDFSVPVCIDETDRLNQLNKFPAGGKFHTFLLDRDNKVVLVGSPVNNENIAELYRDILLAPDTVSMMRTDVEISQREVNFPKTVKDSIQYSFPLKNVGNKKLLINAVNVSCGCTSVEYTKQPINPGDSGLVKVFVKKEKEGYFNETITVYCNVSDSPLVLKLYGNAI